MTAPGIKTFCEAVKKHEGWKPGSRSFRNHNPGNLRFVGQKNATADTAGYAIFKTDEDGWAALVALVERAARGQSKVYRPTMTIAEFFRVYAPAADRNDPERYARVVAKACGCTPRTTLAALLATPPPEAA